MHCVQLIWKKRKARDSIKKVRTFFRGRQKEEAKEIEKETFSWTAVETAFVPFLFGFLIFMIYLFMKVF